MTKEEFQEGLCQALEKPEEWEIFEAPGERKIRHITTGVFVETWDFIHGKRDKDVVIVYSNTSLPLTSLLFAQIKPLWRAVVKQERENEQKLHDAAVREFLADFRGFEGVDGLSSTNR